MNNQLPLFLLLFSIGMLYSLRFYGQNTFTNVFGYFFLMFVICFFFLLLTLRKSYKSLVANISSVRIKFSNALNSASLVRIIFIYIISQLVAGVVLLLFLLIANPVFLFEPTNAVNWFSVHSYPKQQDYFYFYVSVPFLAIVGTIIFILLLMHSKDE